MNYGAESATARLWRDKAEIREQERNVARARTKIAEEKVAIPTAEIIALCQKTHDCAPKWARNP